MRDGAPPARTRRWLIGAGLLGLAGGAVYLLLPPADVLVAGLAPEGREYQLVASFLVGRDTLRMARTVGPPAPAGRSTQVWALVPGAAPASLGLVPEQASWRISLPAELVPRAPQMTIALSDEPAGGAASGEPTQPFLAAASLTAR